MFRVTKVNGYFGIITYGSPEERRETFTKSLPNKTYKVEVMRIPLSLMSNLINILRNNTKHSTMYNTIRDNNVFLSGVVEACIGKVKEEKESVKGDSNLSQFEKDSKIDQLNKKIMSMKLLKLIQNKKMEKELNETKKSENEDVECLEKENNLHMENSNEKIDINNGSRRTHCFLYLFKKLSS